MTYREVASDRSRCMEIVCAALLALALVLLSVPRVFADDARIFSQPCERSPSARSFARRSAAYCLTQPNKKLCERRSSEYFARCGFDGNFKALSREAHADLLLMFVFAKVPSIAHRPTLQSN